MEIRLETINRSTDKLKDVFRNSGSLYSDIAKQLDSAEEDLTEADENIKSLESRQKTGEISLETYKESISGLPETQRES